MKQDHFDVQFMGKLDLTQIEKATQYLKRTRWKRRALSLSFFLIIMYYLIYNALDNVSDYSPLKMTLLTAGTLLLGGIMGILLGKITVRKRLKGMFEPALKKGYIGEYAVNDSGIQTKVKEECTFFEWETFESAHEFDDMFLLIINKYSYMLLPKIFFRTEEDIHTFKIIISSHIKKGNI